MRKFYSNGTGYGNDELPKHGKRITSFNQVNTKRLYLLQFKKGWFVTKLNHTKDAVEMAGLGTKTIPEQYEIYKPAENIGKGIDVVNTYDSEKEFWSAVEAVYEMDFFEEISNE